MHQFLFTSENPILILVECDKNEAQKIYKQFTSMGYVAPVRSPVHMIFRQKTFFEKYILRI